MRLGILLVLALCTGATGAPSRATLEAGRREMMASCRKCHPLQVIQHRRFPREDWDRVLEKMIALGARIGKREALLDYLSVKYGEKRPPGAAKR